MKKVQKYLRYSFRAEGSVIIWNWVHTAKLYNLFNVTYSLVCVYKSIVFVGLMALDRTELKIYENTGLERERRFAKVVYLSSIVFEKLADYVFLKIFP